MGASVSYILWAYQERKKLKENFFLAVSTGSVISLKKIIAENQLGVAAEIVKLLKSKGARPLLLAIKGQHFEMVKFLVRDLNADICQLGHLKLNGQDFNVPPIFSAIIYGRSPDESIIYYLMDQGAANKKSSVLNSVKSSRIPQRDKKDILNLVGAVYMLRAEGYDAGFRFGKKCWMNAMGIRRELPDTIPKMPTKFSEWARNVLGISEFTTIEEFEREEYRSSAFKFQALLIIDRIGSRILRGPHPFFLRQLINLFRLPGVRQFSFQIDMLIIALEGLRRCECKHVINSGWANPIVCRAMNLIPSIFKQSQSLPQNHLEKLSFVRVMVVLRCLLDLHFKFLQHPGVRVSFIVEKMSGGMVELFDAMHLLNSAETKEFEQWLCDYISNINGHSGVFTPLHAACRLKSLKLIRLLLDAGAD